MSRRSIVRRMALRSTTVALAGALLCVVVPCATNAGLPPQGASGESTDPQVARDIHDAEQALRAGHIDLAILQLKNALVLQPRNATVRARLGLALLAHGEITSAEAELRQAKADGAPPALAVPTLLEIMIARNETKSVLDEFPDPGLGASGHVASQILRARGLALASMNRMDEAKSALDRALAMERSIDTLLARAQIAHVMGDDATGNQLIDEAITRYPNDDRPLFAKTEVLRHHDDAKALEVANRIIARDPKSISGKIERILILHDLKQTATAMNELNALLAKWPQLPAAIYYKAQFLAEAHQTREAWLLADALPREYVQSDPNIAISISGIAIANGNFESAGAILSELINNHPENSVARLRLGAVRIKQGSYDLAAQILAPLVEDKDPQALGLMAESSFHQGHYSETLDYLERANAVGSGDELLKKDLALAEMSLGKPAQGIQDFQKLANSDPGRVDFSGPLIGAYIAQKRYDDAQTALEKFAAASGKSPFVGLYKAEILLGKGDRTDAIAAFGDSLKVDPKFVPALYYRAAIEFSIGQTPQATEDTDRILAIDPANMYALIEKASISAKSGQDGRAIDTLKLAISRAPKNPLPRLALTNLQLTHKKYDDAAITISAWLQAIPNDPDALARLGQVQLEKGQKKEAVATFATLADHQSHSPLAQVLLAQASFTAGDTAGANAALKRAILLAPDSLQFRGLVISTELKEKNGDGALAAAKDFQTSHPGADADLLLSDVYVRLQRLGDAKKTLEDSVGRAPDDRVVTHLAQVEVMQGDVPGALTLVGGALQKNESDIDLRREHASLLLQSGNAAAARSDYEAVLRQWPDDSQTLNDLAWIIQDQDPTRALALATKAVQAAPASGEIADTLGWLMYRRGNARGASDVLSRAHNDSSGNGEISYHLAVVLNAIGRRPEAKALLEATLASDHDFADLSAARKLVAQWQ